MDGFGAPMADSEIDGAADARLGSTLGLVAMTAGMIGPWTCYFGNLVGVCAAAGGLYLSMRARKVELDGEAAAHAKMGVTSSGIALAVNGLMVAFLLLIVLLYAGMIGAIVAADL